MHLSEKHYKTWEMMRFLTENNNLKAVLKYHNSIVCVVRDGYFRPEIPDACDYDDYMAFSPHMEWYIIYP